MFIFALGVYAVRLQHRMSTISPYAGEEMREIASLTDADIESLQTGTGVAFGGMAKPAELNGYPGPRHVLDLADELHLTTVQQNSVQALFENMENDAIPLGEQIIDIEKTISVGFADKTLTKERLEELLKESAELYEKLRFVHLSAHFDTVNILTPEQVTLYNELRGYTTDDDPCAHIPEGHDPAMWKLHHGCE